MCKEQRRLPVFYHLTVTTNRLFYAWPPTVPAWTTTQLPFAEILISNDVTMEPLVRIYWIGTIFVDGANVNESVAIFYDLVFSSISRHTPLRGPNLHNTNYQPWWNPDLRHQRNVLRKVRLRFLRHRTDQNKAHLRNLEAEYNENVTSAFREYINRIQDEVKDDPFSFFAFLQR